MRTRPSLRNVRHRVMITPASPLRTGIIHVSRTCCTIYRYFENILKWENCS